MSAIGESQKKLREIFENVKGISEKVRGISEKLNESPNYY